MLDDDSDLTDIDDDEDEYKERKAPGPKKATVGTNYRIRKALKVPRATTYTAQALYEQIHNSDINLEPEYQRDVVWPESKQIGIIDSVFRNFYIPPVIFVVNSLEDGSETKTCIDGKQRLTSIHRFMDGLIPHKDSVTGEKLWYTDVAPDAKTSRARKLLPEKYRRVFANKQIVCVEYQDITENDEREIFQRVQLGMALTPAEKLQVISSPRATLIRGLLATFLTEDNSDALSWERARGADFRCLAQAAYCISGYDLGGQNLGTALQLEKWLAQPGDPDPALVKKVKDTYRLFAELVLDKKLNKPFKQSQKVSPVEFIAISILIAVHKDDMSMAELAAAIGDMRDKVRDKHDDIRTNAKVAKTLLDFIRDLKPGKSAGPPAGSTTAVVKQEKRKRNDVDDEEPVKRKSKKPTPPRASSSATASSSVRSLPTPTSKPPSLTQLPTPAPAPTPTPKPRTHPLPSRRDSAPQSQLPPTAPAHDRMAALRAAKNNMAALSITPSFSAPATFSHFPHLLPTGAGTSSTSPRITQDTSLEASIMALASRSEPAAPVSAGGWSASSRYGPEAEYASRERDRERDGDRDRGRDRDRDRDRNRDRDREREREREKKAERDWEKEMEYRANASGRGGRSGRAGG